MFTLQALAGPVNGGSVISCDHCATKASPFRQRGCPRGRQRSAVRAAGSELTAERTRPAVIGGQDAARTTAAPVVLSVIGEPRAEHPAPTCPSDWHQTCGMAVQVPFLVAVCVPGPAG